MITTNSLNVKQEFQAKQKKYEYDILQQNIDNFYSNVQYKTRLLNIDSKFRNKYPKNIYTSTNDFLPNNSIYTTYNSNIIKINYPNHKFNIGDRVIIQNATGNTKILSNSIYFFNNFQYMFIYFKNHNIPLNFLDFYDEFKINIEIINDIGYNTLYSNIPINSIIGIFNITLPSIVDKETPLLPVILDTFNVNSVSELDNNYIMIQLPFNFITSSDNYYISPDVFKISFMNIGGIPLTYINADYPINYQRNQGYQEIINIDSSFIYIETSIKASYNFNSGGNKLQIMTIIKTLPGYPDANNYMVELKNNFNNVVRIELASSEFPYIDFLVKTNNNNKLYWKHFDDGNFIYTTSIPEGNYDSTNLVSTIKNALNNVERLGSTIENPIYNIFDITMDTFTQEINITAFKNNNLPNSLSATIDEIDDVKYVKLTIYHPGNLVEKLDTIQISDAIKIGTIIDATYINKSHIVYSVNIPESTYSVLLAPLNQITNATSIDLTGNGGPSTIVKTKAKVSFLFNKNNTLGDILGFKNVGEPNAITPFKTTISNFDPYIEFTNLNQVGNIDTTTKLLNLSGSNYYILMYINDYESVINNSNQLTAFAKILLSGTPGDILFNTFVNYPLEFDFPIATLNELNIKFLYPNGDFVDFRNIDHSFTLRIIEKISNPYNTGLNSKDTNVLDTIKKNDI